MIRCRRSRDRPIEAVPRLLTRAEAAASLGISIAHFERYVQPFVRVVPCGQPLLIEPSSLDRWRDAVHGGRYAGVRYDCASPSVARWIRRRAKKVWLTPPDFSVIVQTTAEEIATLAGADARREGGAADEPETTADVARTPDGMVSIAPVDVRVSAASAPMPTPGAERPETPEEAAERERRYRQIFGIPEPKRHRRWRR